MTKDLFLKVRHYGPLCEGSSTLDNGFIRIPTYTIFIGDQGTGKSTVAKLVSTLSWLEKSFIRRGNDPNSFTVDKLVTLLENQNLPKEYINDNTELEFHGQVFTITLSKREIKVMKDESADYVCPQIIYFPSERNILSAMRSSWDVKGLPEMVYELAGEYYNAMNYFGRRRRRLFDGFSVDFDTETRTTYVTEPGRTTRIPLASASSGLQSITPLLVVSRYLNNLLSIDFLDRLRQNPTIRIDSINMIGDGMLQSKLRDFFKSGLRDSITPEDEQKIKEILGRYVNSCLWQIVEEPEQNLYPTSQVKMVNELISCTGEEGKLIMTTHSPYILSVLNNYLFAYDRYRQLGKCLREIPSRYFVDYDQTAAYKLEGGSIHSIMNPQARMIDATQIDECSSQTNALFDKLMDMGDVENES